MAACNQSRLNSKSCPESVRRYGNSSLNATMILIDCDVARSGGGSRSLFGCLRRKQLPLERIRPYSAAKSVNGIYKLIDILKSLVHRGVTQIRHLIEPAQFFEHLGSDHRRRNLAPAGFKFVHNFIHHLLQSQKTGGAFFKSFRNAGGQLAAIKRLVCSVPFYNAQIRALDFLIGSKAIFAFQTFATAADA